MRKYNYLAGLNVFLKAIIVFLLFFLFLNSVQAQSTDGRVLSSSTYVIQSISIGSGGAELGSNTYRAKVGIGEIGSNELSSTTYKVTLGFYGANYYGAAAPSQGGGWSCGDRVCQPTENSVTCPLDCAAVCGDRACTRDENLSTCPQDCLAVCGDGICSETAGENFNTCSTDCNKPVLPGEEVVIEKVLEKKVEKELSQAEARKVLEDAGIAKEVIEKAAELAKKVKTETSVEVIQITDKDKNVVFNSKVNLAVENSSNEDLLNVQIVTVIPKEIAQSAFEVKTQNQHVVLQEDPVIGFNLPVIKAKEKANLSYTLVKKLEASDVEKLVNAIPIQLIGGVSCGDLVCNDGNPCTNDSCSNAQCAFTPVKDGTSCGFGKVCVQGVCRSREVITPPEKEKAKPLDNTLVLGLIVVVVLALAAFYVLQSRKEKAVEKKVELIKKVAQRKVVPVKPVKKPGKKTT